MPEGVMEWFDPGTGTGRIAKGGHRFTVSASNVERPAQVAGAASISTSTVTNPATRST